MEFCQSFKRLIRTNFVLGYNFLSKPKKKQFFNHNESGLVQLMTSWTWSNKTRLSNVCYKLFELFI